MAIALRAEHNTVRSGDPVLLKVSLSNRSSHGITFGYDRTRDIVDFDVLDETGRFAQDKRPGYHNGRLDLEQLAQTTTADQLIKSGVLTGNVVWVTLKPGGTFVQTIEIGKYFDLAKPGAYKIAVQRPDPETASLVKSDAIELTVTK